MIPRDDQVAAGQGGRGALAKAVAGLHVAEVFFPEKFSVEVVAVEAARAEGGVEPFAVRQRGGGGKAVRGMAPLVGHLAAGGFLPDDFTRGAVEGDDGELVDFGRLHAAAEAAAAALAALALGVAATGRGWGRRRGRVRRAGDGLGGFDGGEQENPVFPHDGGGETVAGDLGLPFEVFFLAPLDGGLRARGDPRAGRAAPSRPRGQIGGGRE